MAVGERNMKILLVDDMQTMRRIVRTLFKQLGYENFHEADNGAAALQVLKSVPGIEFICSDWNMPTMTGLDFLKAVRADPQFKHLPFLMITAEAERQNIVDAVQAGVSNYVVKPFTGHTLQEKLAKIFQAHKAKKKAS